MKCNFLLIIFILLYCGFLSRETRRNNIIVHKYNGADKYMPFYTLLGGSAQELKK